MRHEHEALQMERIELQKKESEERVRFSNLQDQLESTRAEFVSSINDKAKEIDKLGSTILDLRKSREDLAIEDQIRFDEVKSQHHQAVVDREAVKKEAERFPEELKAMQEVQGSLSAQLEGSRQGHTAEARRLQGELDDISRAHQDAVSSTRTVSMRCQELETILSALRTEILGHQERESALQREMAIVKSEREKAMQEKQRAMDDFDRYQRSAAQTGSKVVAELREEIVQLRKSRDKAAEASKRNAVEHHQVTEGLRTQVNGLQTSLDAEKEKTECREKRMKELVRSAGEDDAKSKLLFAKVDSLNAVLEERAREIVGLQDQVQSERKRADEAERKEKEARQHVKESEGRITHSQAELDNIVSLLDRAHKDKAALEAAVQSESGRASRSEEALHTSISDANRRVAELSAEVGRLTGKSEESRSDRSKAEAALQTEVDSRQRLESQLKGEISRLTQEAAEVRLEMVNLETQVQQERTTRQRLDGELRKARTARTDSADVRNTEEIERLEKLVEVQKTLIDDQREKIKFWAQVSSLTSSARHADVYRNSKNNEK